MLSRKILAMLWNERCVDRLAVLMREGALSCTLSRRLPAVCTGNNWIYHLGQSDSSDRFWSHSVRCKSCSDAYRLLNAVNDLCFGLKYTTWSITGAYNDAVLISNHNYSPICFKFVSGTCKDTKAKIRLKWCLCTGDVVGLLYTKSYLYSTCPSSLLQAHWMALI
jgi:hypothetical protein